MSDAVVNSSPLLVRCVFVSDSSIFVTNIFSLILGICVAVLARPDGENLRSSESVDLIVGIRLREVPSLESVCRKIARRKPLEHLLWLLKGLRRSGLSRRSRKRR